MTTFQLVTLPLLAVLIVITAVATARSRVTPRIGLGWILLWLSAAIAIAFPDLLVWLAQVLGIGRGTDLVLYVFILVGFVAFFATYLRFRRLDEQMTKIVRHIAIENAAREQDAKQAEDPRVS
jgi:small membrane protein